MSHLYVPNAGNLLDYASATLDTSTGNLTGILEWPCPSTLPASLPGTQITAPV